MKKLFRKRHLFFWYLKHKKLKLNVGSAAKNFDKTWFATDIETLNLTKEDDWKKLLGFLRVDYIMAEHVWEHLLAEDTILANKNCYRFLKKKGVLRIAVPDGFHPDPGYIEHVKPAGSGFGASDHKILYNYKTLKQSLEEVGFTVSLLEYWDENKEFHFIDWSDEGGHIVRSKRYDKRNQQGILNYTSLIVDAIKD